ncbi:caspase family protein [Paraflavitalea sp. CAU 1676]|uniref:caspase family protein n=1 Tax=Paraflavitalea sp. CAU 1676 TaxID=3032598 RepID=UPI0023DC1D5F|nr:caspase family protein [Paraflavitalea sp. CAU 1676]MDF2188322.1 caspase family protein [Paraflavitalea sp. CAU 1676]
MSLVFNEINDNPQTHVFIIGVGSYPWLKDGAHYRQGQNKLLGSMGQLTSAPVSALAFYKTVIGIHNGDQTGRWLKPLGSIELLISEYSDSATPKQPTCDKATWQNIYQGYVDWKARCDTNEDNVAIFYFCGHGLEKADQYLLTEGFGSMPEMPWREAFNFDHTRRAFHSCKAQTQLFFIDSCRMVPYELLDKDISVMGLDNAAYLDSECKYNLTLKASAHNEKAFGDPNQVSVYSSALILALTGQGATGVEDEWRVDTSLIASRIYELMELIKPGQGDRQRCSQYSNRSTEIIGFAEPPQVVMNLTCLPESALGVAELSYRHSKSSFTERRTPTPAPWKINVKAGIYEVSADFNANEFKPQKDFVTANPPSVKKSLNVI